MQVRSRNYRLKKKKEKKEKRWRQVSVLVWETNHTAVSIDTFYI